LRTREIIEEVRTSLPGGLPAIWEQTDEKGVRLYLRDDLPPEMADHFRIMATSEPVAAA
jgi:hypothetical protein